LFAVGDKFGRRELADAILHPSATIDVGYSTTILETKSGEELCGIIKQATDDWLELVDAQAHRIRIATSEIQDRRTSDVSLMPEGLAAGLTVQEFADLVEFLVSLKQPLSTAMLSRGMPQEIPQLARPVILQPLIREELRFGHPVWFGAVPGQSNVFLVVEHETGRIWRLEKTGPREEKTLFADLGEFQQGTRGLLGIALHPQFANVRKYYFAKHTVDRGVFSTIIGERETSVDGTRDAGKPTRVVLELREATNVHYGGGLQFGPDGFLYIGMGDSGPQEDPQGHGQNTKEFLGKMLRIDVDHGDDGRPYSIPVDNPFLRRSDIRPEIWAYGFREPWRFSFDALTGDLWVGDVGQDRYEEIDLVRAGENYGWNVYEGFEPFSNQYRRNGETYVPPVFAYPRKFGVSVTGGYVYRANPHSSFYGVYIFGDYESRRLFGLTEKGRSLVLVRQIGTAPERVVSFGTAPDGKLFVVGYEGMIYRLDFENALFPVASSRAP
jgi:putative heme-binding domain-containing protein